MSSGEKGFLGAMRDGEPLDKIAGNITDCMEICIFALVTLSKWPAWAIGPHPRIPILRQFCPALPSSHDTHAEPPMVATTDGIFRHPDNQAAAIRPHGFEMTAQASHHCKETGEKFPKSKPVSCISLVCTYGTAHFFRLVFSKQRVDMPLHEGAADKTSR